MMKTFNQTKVVQFILTIQIFPAKKWEMNSKRNRLRPKTWSKISQKLYLAICTKTKKSLIKFSPTLELKNSSLRWFSID